MLEAKDCKPGDLIWVDPGHCNFDSSPNIAYLTEQLDKYNVKFDPMKPLTVVRAPYSPESTDCIAVSFNGVEVGAYAARFRKNKFVEKVYRINNGL